jgi:hypothetical protein
MVLQRLIDDAFNVLCYANVFNIVCLPTTLQARKAATDVKHAVARAIQRAARSNSFRIDFCVKRLLLRRLAWNFE